jgi:PAS domain S-box-containing protein
MAAIGDDLAEDISEALDCGMIILDSDQKVVVWNRWLVNASTIPADAAIGRRLNDIFPNATLRRLNSSILDAMSSGASSLVTHSLNPRLLPLRTPAGRELIHDLSVRPMGRKPYRRCLVQITDVTVAVLREQVLRDRQAARYAAVVDTAPDVILTMDAHGVIQLANPAAARAFAGTAEDLLDTPVVDLFDQPQAWAELWRSLIDGETMARPVEFLAHRFDGAPTHLEVSASRWLDDSRAFVTAILRDVNERHATDAALRRLNETLEERVALALAERKLLADLFETTDAVIFVADLDHRLMAVNRAAADELEIVYGVRPQVGDCLLDLVADHPEDQSAMRTLWGRALAGEAYSIVHAFGSPEQRRHYEMKFEILRDADGRQIGAYQFVYDVTERLQRQQQLARTEEALRQSQKMEAIGQLTGGIAHDFNNLLTGIIGAMDILKRRLSAGRYDDTQRFMDAASTSASRAAALTHRLLAFARRQPLDPKPLEPNRLIRGMEDLLHRTLSEQIVFETRLAPDLWLTLSDPNQLENAILNLVINARDAMPSGGKLRIATENRSVTEAFSFGQEEVSAGDYVVVSVKDTGVGMDAEMISKVFEPFFTTKPLGQGTGLGLSMIYGFAKQTRGHVQIESRVGEGAEVSLFLPRYSGEATAQRNPAEVEAEAPAGSGETVLLVEDDSAVRLLIGEVLRDLGYVCIEAIDGQAALPMLNSNARIDLMITDVGLPGLNGRQLADLARQQRPELKILFVTGYAEHATGVGRFLEPGMEMVTKPFTLDALALKIRDILTPHRKKS